MNRLSAGRLRAGAGACASIALALALGLALQGATGEAWASGVGATLQGRGGSTDWDVFDSDVNDVDQGAGFVAFMFETNPTGEKIFSYRFNIGAEGIGTDLRLFAFDPFTGTTLAEDKLHLGGVASEHTFALALLRTKPARVWIGPALRVGVLGGRLEDLDLHALVGELGAGLAIGANFHMGSRFTLGVSLSAMAVGYNGILYQDVEDIGDDDFSIDGQGGEIGFSLHLLTRTGSHAN